MACIFMLLPMLMELAVALEILQELGMAAYETDNINDSQGTSQAVSAAFRDAAGRTVGLQKAQQGFRLVIDSKGLTPRLAEKQTLSLNRFVQRYAFRVAGRHFKGLGYAVEEEDLLADGSLRLLLCRWLPGASGAAAKQEVELTVSMTGEVKALARNHPAHGPVHGDIGKLVGALGALKSQQVSSKCTAPVLQQVRFGS